MTEKARILIVDDEEHMRSSISRLLIDNDYGVDSASCAEEALAKLDDESFDIVLLDVNMPRISGMELLKKIRTEQLRVDIIMMTGYATIGVAVKAMKLGAYDFLEKPCDNNVMLAAIERLHEKRTLANELKKAHEQREQSIRKKELLLSEIEKQNKEYKIINERLRYIIENDSDGIMVTSRNGIIYFVNPAAENLFRRKDSALIGEQFGIPASISDTAMEIDIVCEDGTPGSAELQSIETEWDGEQAYLVIIRDITRRKIYEEMLMKTNEELRKLDDLKSEFISIASHELRTPLTSIKNAVDILLKGKAGSLTDAQEKFLSMAQRNINRLSALINDMLHISKIESGKMEYRYARIDIREIIGNVINTFQSLAQEKSIALRQVISPDLPAIQGDIDKIEQVLINLVGNAIKFTPEQGIITIHGNTRESVADMPENATGYLEISVADTGIGIPEEHREHLFEKFYQASNSLARQDQSGTGLGLAICKGIVEGHKGKIWVESSEGVGSIFRFALPATDLEEQPYKDILESELLKARQNAEPLSVMIIKVRDLAEDSEQIIEQVKEKIISGRIKTSDKIAVSLPDKEIMLIMPGTGKTEEALAQKRIMKFVVGNDDGIGFCDYILVSAATYPDDGCSAEELVDCARRKLEGIDNDSESLSN